MQHTRLISKFWILRLWLFLLLAMALVSAGCSYRDTVAKTSNTVTKTTQKITRKIRFSDDDLQRMTAVVGFENKSLYQEKEIARVFRDGIPKYLNTECDDVTVANQDANQNMQSFEQLPRLESGQVDNFALAIFGRALGLNAVITGSLDDIGMVDEMRGMLFKDTQHLIQILVSIEVFDTETGTKILDQNFSRKVEIEDLDYELMRSEGKLILPDLDDTLKDLIAEMGEAICWAIEDQPWNGFITAVAADKVTLSSGSMVGLEKGDALEVFDTSRILKGRNGQQFFVHGQKVGEIKIIEVEPNMANATVVKNDGIKTGNSVRVK